MFDLLVAKKWALKYAVNAACTILRVRNSLFSIIHQIRRIIERLCQVVCKCCSWFHVHADCKSSCLPCHSGWPDHHGKACWRSKAERHKRRNGPGRRLNPKNLQARNFYTPLCICENFEYVFVDRAKYVFECCSINAIECFDEAWLIHDLDLEAPCMYLLVLVTHSQTVRCPARRMPHCWNKAHNKY